MFLLPAGAYQLTPRYDVLSTYPMLGHGRGKLAPEKITMAMAVEGKNRHDRWASIHARHWLEKAKRCGLAGMSEIVTEVVAQTPAVVERVRALVPAGFPLDLADAILDGVRAASERVTTELAET